MSRDVRMVHDNTSHTDERSIINCAAVQNHTMADADAIAERGSAFFVGAVDNCSVLNIGFAANSNSKNIAAQNGVVPNRTFLTDYDITNDCCIWGNETACPDFWGL